MKKKRYFSRGMLTLLAAVFAFLFLMPTVLTITNSFMTQSEITANYGQVFSSTTTGSSYISKTINLKFIPDKVSFTQYITVLLKSPEYLLKFWNSVILVAPIVLAQLAVASVAAYGFTRWRGKIRDTIFFAYVILMLMPYQVTLVPNYLVSDFLGLLNTRWAIILPGAFAPFSVFLLTKSMRRIPASLIESAKLDGCGNLRFIVKILMPLTKSAMGAMAVYTFINAWNMYMWPLLVTGSDSKRTVQIGISMLNSVDAQSITLMLAGVVMIIIPSISIFIVGQKALIKGMFSGAVKG